MQRLCDTSGKCLGANLKANLKNNLKALLIALEARLKNIRGAFGERWRHCRPKRRVEGKCPWAPHPAVIRGQAFRGLVLGGLALCLVLVVLARRNDLPRLTHLTHPGPDVFVKNPKRVQAAGEMAGKDGGAFDGWYRFPVESWQLARVKPDIGSLERKGSSLGYSCVREPVGIATGSPRVPAPLLAGEGREIVVWVPDNLAEPLDARGRPLRWAADADALDAHVGLERREPQEPARAYHYVSRARGLGYKGPILRHESTVRKFADMYKLPQHLIFAVMQVESGGRQELVSPRDARGLMQVQPSTAGSEVARYLARRAGEGESTSRNVHAALSDPDQNILYGASYLHILDKRYFRDVTDKESRLLCVLAAYNMGPGRLQRLFGATPEESVARINSYSPMGLYEEIKARFEDVPGYDYMDRVITLMLQYRKMGY